MFKKSFTFNVFMLFLLQALGVLKFRFIEDLKAVHSLSYQLYVRSLCPSKFMTSYFFFQTDRMNHKQRQTNITTDFSPVGWGKWGLLPQTLRFKWLELGASFLENLLLDLSIRHLLLQNVKQLIWVASCGLCDALLFSPYALVCTCALLLTI